jgi:hypothetical protein
MSGRSGQAPPEASPGLGWGRPPAPCHHRGMRPGTTIALGLLLVAILAAAAVQFVMIATR